MANHSAPKCPKCGSSDGKPLSKRDGYLNDPPQSGEHAVSTAIVFLCPCGETFTHVVNHVRGRK